MATARYVLHTLAGIDRPAINTTLPSLNNHTHMLDLGANVESDAKDLFRFAMMGDAFARAVLGLSRPKIGLPNVGKSTLMNAFMQQKIAIVPPRPQTTRTVRVCRDGRGGADAVAILARCRWLRRAPVHALTRTPVIHVFHRVTTICSGVGPTDRRQIRHVAAKPV